MGGRALKKTFTRRYQREEFDQISVELLEILNKSFKRATMPLFYSKKESFGDADIIVDMDGCDFEMYDYIEKTFSPNEIFVNSNCYSFDYKELQVDLIVANGENFISNFHYLSFNDLGNFIGRIAHSLGLKYGQEGLWYEHYFKDQNIGRVIISRDYSKIFTFLGFSYERWLKGFETLEDVFDFVIENKNFDYEMFQLRNLTKINRERNIKRNSYMSFLVYIENFKDRRNDFTPVEKTLNDVKNIFPEAQLGIMIRELEYKYTRKLYIKSKYSGGEVISCLNLEPKDVIKVMRDFKNHLMNGFKMMGCLNVEEEFEEWVIRFSTEHIYEQMKIFLDEEK